MTYSLYKEKTIMAQKKKKLGKSDISKEQEEKKKKRKRTQTVVTKQNKTKRNTRERQHNIRLEDISSRHLRLVNHGERTSTSPPALGYPLAGSSRHDWTHARLLLPMRYGFCLITESSWGLEMLWNKVLSALFIEHYTHSMVMAIAETVAVATFIRQQTKPVATGRLPKSILSLALLLAAEHKTLGAAPLRTTAVACPSRAVLFSACTAFSFRSPGEQGLKKLSYSTPAQVFSWKMSNTPSLRPPQEGVAVCRPVKTLRAFVTFYYLRPRLSKLLMLITIVTLP